MRSVDGGAENESNIAFSAICVQRSVTTSKSSLVDPQSKYIRSITAPRKLYVKKVEKPGIR